MISNHFKTGDGYVILTWIHFIFCDLFQHWSQVIITNTCNF